MATNKKIKTLYNPDMLFWAREWRGLSPEEAAKKVNKSAEDVLAWEAGNGGPTVKQARTLAQAYGRAFVEFFRKDRPTERPQEVIPDYRMHRDHQPDAGSWAVRDIERWAITQRLNSLDLFETLGDTPPRLPERLSANTRENVEVAAVRIREAVGFSEADQLLLKHGDRDELPKILRQKFEKSGILTLKRSSMKAIGARGLCFASDLLPVIVYTNEAPAAQAFTLAHELGHVAIRQSALIDKRPFARLAISARPSSERWCDKFAAAFLIPRGSLSRLIERPNEPWDKISSGKLGELAGAFRVSQHAMLIRLVNLKYVKPAFYWRVKRDEFIADEDAYEAFGRAPYYGSRYRSSLGDLYTGLVLEAWNTGRITNHNASEFMGIKNPEHLFRIRDEFAA